MGNASSARVSTKSGKGLKLNSGEEHMPAVIVTPDGDMDLQTVLFGPQASGAIAKAAVVTSKSPLAALLAGTVYGYWKSSNKRVRLKPTKRFKSAKIWRRSSKANHPQDQIPMLKRANCADLGTAWGPPTTPEAAWSSIPLKSPDISSSMLPFAWRILSEASTTSRTSSKSTDTGSFPRLSLLSTSSRRSSKSSTTSTTSPTSTDTGILSRLSFLSVSSRQSSKSSPHSSPSVVSDEQVSKLTSRLSATPEADLGIHLDLHPETADRNRLLEIQSVIFKRLLDSFSDGEHASLGQSKLPRHPRVVLLKFQYPIIYCRAGSKEFAHKMLYAIAFAVEKFKPALLAAEVPDKEIDHVISVLHRLSNASTMQGDGEDLLVGGKNVSGNLHSIASHFRCQKWKAFGSEVGNFAWRLCISSWVRSQRCCMKG